MRNLKKILALVLALVMVVGMMTVANAAYTDADQITASYDEAVEVLTGLGIYRGTGDGSTFSPKANITRAEVATLVYRLLTQDVADVYVDNFDYKSFADVDEGKWYTGYVTYAANGGYVVGDGTNFYPNANVTGIQTLTILLRAMGYGVNGEYTGDDWTLKVMTKAKELGLLAGVVTNDLSQPASRELVAQILFNAMTKANVVKYVNYYGYQDQGITLGYKTFKLTKSDRCDIDDWGRPGYFWFAGSAVVATIEEGALDKYNVAVSDCDIATDMGLPSKAYNGNYTYYDNGVKGLTYIDVTSTVANNGGQGVQIEVYADRVIRIDTYLAQVGTVYPTRTDAAGHVTFTGYSDLTIFGATKNATYTGLDLYTTAFATGTMILVNVNEKDVPYVVPVQVAESFTGAQTVIWYNQARHTVNNTLYQDAEHFHLDEVGTETTQHLWYKDQYGNLIGVVDIDNSNYAVLKDIIWTDSAAVATLVFMDGSEETVTVATMDGLDAYAAEWVTGYTVGQVTTNDGSDKVPYLDDQAIVDSQFGGISRVAMYNAEYLGYALYRVDYNENGTVNLEGYENGAEVINRAYMANLDSGSRQFTDNGTKVVVTTNTQILVRELAATGEYYYVNYTIDTLPEYVAGTVDMFYTTTNGVATRIYVKSAVKAAEDGDHLFVVSDTITELAGVPGVYWMSVVIDGVTETVYFTDLEIAQTLAANVGKLYHVSVSPYLVGAKMITGIELINEGPADWTWHNGTFCDYLYGSIVVTGNTLINGGTTYALNDSVKYYTYDAATETLVETTIDAVNAAAGVWVVGSMDSKGVETAHTVYIGTKLSANTNAYVNGSAANSDNEFVITLPLGETSTDIVWIDVYNQNTVVEIGGEALLGDVVGTDIEIGEYTFYVIAEDGVAYEEYTLIVKKAANVFKYELVKATMDSKSGAEIEIALYKNGTLVNMDSSKPLSCKITLINKAGTEVYSTEVEGTITANGTLVVNAPCTLTAGAEYMAVVEIVYGLTDVEGTVVTNYIEAQTSTAD